MTAYKRLPRRFVTGGLVTILLAGCGAAYYGAAIGIVATQEDETTVDTSFPDAIPTAPRVPAYLTLELSSTQITVTRNSTGGFFDGSTGQTSVSTTDFEVTAVEFPAGFGTAQSNRDSEQNLLSGDRLTVRINGDTAQEITFGSSDVASVGSEVAATIQTKVRALSPIDTQNVPTDAYDLFTATFNLNTKAYEFRSGVPGERSAVVWDPDPTPTTGDAVADTQSEATSSRLGLGIDFGGIEVSGAESITFRVINRGTDSIPAGTTVTLYLSHDKTIDSTDIPFDNVSIPDTIAVGEARLVTRSNGNPLPQQLVKSDFTDGKYYVLFDVASSGGETITSNNTTNSLIPVQVYQPIDDPATDATETANTLDFVPTATSSAIAAVASTVFGGGITVTNYGAVVPTGGVPIEVELTLSVDDTYEAPAAFLDPNGAVAGVRINPSNPNTPYTVTIDSSGTNPLSTSTFGTTITVSFNGTATGITSVNSLVEALNNVSGTPVDAFTDGKGDAANDDLVTLLNASGQTTQTAEDLFVSTRSITFPATTRQQQAKTFTINGSIRNEITTSLLPLKLIPFYKITPSGTTFTTPNVAENTNNNVREAANYVRVYNPAFAQFDAETGAQLPTINSDDFLALDAVISRPVNAGSIRQGQQRVFSFQIPDTTLTIDEAQLLVILNTSNFDAHIDLLAGNGAFITGTDDSGLGSSPIIYTPVTATANNRTFYLVVSAARFDESDLSGGGETFDITISVNSRDGNDPGLVKASPALNLTSATNQRYALPTQTRIENNVLIPFSMTNTKAEVLFVLPQRARVIVRSTPVFTTGTQTELTAFVSGNVPSPVEFQPALDVTSSGIVYRPSGGTVDTSHTFEAGVYTLAWEGNAGDDQALRLEVTAEFIPDDTTSSN